MLAFWLANLRPRNSVLTVPGSVSPILVRFVPQGTWRRHDINGHTTKWTSFCVLSA